MERNSEYVSEKHGRKINGNMKLHMTLTCHGLQDVARYGMEKSEKIIFVHCDFEESKATAHHIVVTLIAIALVSGLL